MPEWKNDKELFAIMQRELYTGAILDTLDPMGYSNQYLPRAIQSIRPNDTSVLVGRAYPTVICDVYGKQDEPLGKLYEAVDHIKEGEIYMVAGGAFRASYFGEIMTASVKRRGAVGAVIDGYHRDTALVLVQDFPVYSRGRDARGSAFRNQVIRYGEPIEIENIWIDPGDLIFADIDGVLVIPKRIEVETVEATLHKIRTEKDTISAIRSGMSAVDAYKKHGAF